jgi:hypothetical protein
VSTPERAAWSQQQSKRRPGPAKLPTAWETPSLAIAETAPEAIDKSMLAFPEPRRQRNKIHLRFVARQPCLICARPREPTPTICGLHKNAVMDSPSPILVDWLFTS